MRIFSEVVSGDYENDVAVMDRLLRVDDSFDIIKRTMVFGSAHVTMYYIDGFVKAEMMQKLLMHMTNVKDFGDGSDGAALRFSESSLPTVEVDATASVDALIVGVLSGCTAMLCDRFGSGALVIDTRTYPARDTAEPDNDRVMRGSRDGFVETLIFNTALIRRRIRDTALTIEYFSVGKSTRTDVALCYMADRVDREYYGYLSAKLRSIDTDSVVLGHQSISECLIGRNWYNPFPKIRATERPDAASATILEGGIILLCDNSPEAMIFPTSIFDFLQETDDFYFPPLTGSYLRLVRQFVFLLTTLVTPLWYLAVMNAAVLPDALRFLIPDDPGALPILLQLYLTEIALDGLKLASLNTPDVLSNSLSVVGGLILGEFAVTVGWLSSDVILYMAVVAIGNFTQSSYELSYAFKYIRIALLALTALFNVWGFAVGIVGSLVLLATTKNANGKRSYLYPLIPFDGKALVSLLVRVKKPDVRR